MSESALWCSLLFALGAGCYGEDVAGRPWQRALDAAEEFEVVSVVSHVDSLSLARTNLMSDFPLKVRMLGFTGLKPEAWSNLQRLKLLHEHVAGLPPDKVVFVLDFFDVVWLSCGRDLVDTFKSFKRPLVFGAELFPYPLNNATIRRMSGYPLALGSQDGDLNMLSGWVKLHGHSRFQEYRYLNAGCFAGFAGAIRKATGRLLANGFQNTYVMDNPFARSTIKKKHLQVGKSDQMAWHMYLWKHPKEIALDYGARLFLNSAGFQLRDFELREGKIWGHGFGRDICFAHGNGGFNVAWALLECQRSGNNPGLLRDMTIHTVIRGSNASVALYEEVL